MQEQELGAQALLLLGLKDPKPERDDALDGRPEDPVLSDPAAKKDDDEYEKNQQLNDAVEAAVMQYVGGTLDNDDDLHEPLDADHKRRLPEDLMDYQWDKFLEEEVEFSAKKHRKPYGGNDIDPELAGLDTAEHDQLVQAAIMGAGELAKQLLPKLAPADKSAPGTRAGTVSPAQALPGGLRTRAAPKSNSKRRKINPDGFPARSKYTFLTLDSLISQASNEACIWFNAQADAGARGPRLFLPEEVDIVEHYLRGYSELYSLTRQDICRRVWLSDRPKDAFWESLTKVLPYRLKALVYKHTRRQYHVFDIRATWTKEEDEHLRQLAEKSLANWKKIGELMHRMPEDCRDRWRNYVKCGENRSMNKWSEDEERLLKDVVMHIITEDKHPDKLAQINWTLVSERMKGLRSRIQCRYKWNKLLHQESLARVALMDTQTKLWLLNRVLEVGGDDTNAIDWEYLVHMYHEHHKARGKTLWTAGDFKIAVNSMRAQAKDGKSTPLPTLLPKLIDKIYRSTHEKDTPPPTQDAASVATAAVAAIPLSVSEQNIQPQEYSLWR